MSNHRLTDALYFVGYYGVDSEKFICYVCISVSFKPARTVRYVRYSFRSISRRISASLTAVRDDITMYTIYKHDDSIPSSGNIKISEYAMFISCCKQWVGYSAKKYCLYLQFKSSSYFGSAHQSTAGPTRPAHTRWIKEKRACDFDTTNWEVRGRAIKIIFAHPTANYGTSHLSKSWPPLTNVDRHLNIISRNKSPKECDPWKNCTHSERNCGLDTTRGCSNIL